MVRDGKVKRDFIGGFMEYQDPVDRFLLERGRVVRVIVLELLYAISICQMDHIIDKLTT